MKDYYYYKFRNRKTVLPIDSGRPNFEEVSSANRLCFILPTLYNSVAPKISSLTIKRYYSYSQVGEIITSLITDFEIAAVGTEQLSKNMKIVVNDAFTDAPENPHDKFKIYDDYFNTVRYNEAPVEVFADQVILICLQQLYDLAESAAAVSEILYGLKGLMTVIQIIVEELPIEESISEMPSGQCLKNELKEEDERAIQRWKVGHAFFALMLLFSKDSLSKLSDLDGAVELEKATTLFRASTSSMWFASIFSPRMYTEVIRPSMISTQAPGGFSGHQNREYSNWAATKKAGVKWMKENKSYDRKMMSAIKRFADIYLQDGEQHILLAAAMVEDKTSLVQDDVIEKYGVKMRKSAVQLLRDIQELRKVEIEFIDNL